MPAPEQPADRKPRNVILILIDSLNRHCLPAYGSGELDTPNLDRLARRAWRFDNHFVGSLPCMPARREIFAGFKEMMWRAWGPLEHHDARLPRLLEERGYTTTIITDHYHYWEESGNGYLQSFQETELIRGHELDNWKTPLRPTDALPRWVENIERWRPGEGRRYYANVQSFTIEEDFFPAKVMTAAARWLDCASSQLDSATRPPFYLQIESFDAHEPFHVIEPYASMFGDGSGYERFTVWPPYQDVRAMAKFMANATPQELAFIRSQYLAKVAMVDRWLGDVLDVLDGSGLWESTAVILTTDHGHDLGERGAFAKSYPHFDSHAKIPLFIWEPDRPGDGEPIASLTSTVDLFSTILDVAGAEVEAVHGRSLLPLVSGREGSEEPDALLYGTFGQGVCCTDGEWTLHKSPQNGSPLHSYSSLYYKPLVIDRLLPPGGDGYFIPEVPVPQWRVPVLVEPLSRENFLFNVGEDPAQQRNLWKDEPVRRKLLLDLLRGLMDREGAPGEQYLRLGLSS